MIALSMSSQDLNLHTKHERTIKTSESFSHDGCKLTMTYNVTQPVTTVAWEVHLFSLCLSFHFSLSISSCCAIQSDLYLIITQTKSSPSSIYFAFYHHLHHNDHSSHNTLTTREVYIGLQTSIIDRKCELIIHCH